MLYVIKLDFEMLNAIFFDMFDRNALINGQTVISHMPQQNLRLYV